MNKRGQVTLFIIIAVLILGAMVYFIYPRIKLVDPIPTAEKINQNNMAIFFTLSSCIEMLSWYAAYMAKAELPFL